MKLEKINRKFLYQKVLSDEETKLTIQQDL